MKITFGENDDCAADGVLVQKVGSPENPQIQINASMLLSPLRITELDKDDRFKGAQSNFYQRVAGITFDPQSLTYAIEFTDGRTFTIHPSIDANELILKIFQQGKEKDKTQVAKLRIPFNPFDKEKITIEEKSGGVGNGKK